MKRRVLLARALAGDPHLLLLDEPTNHLDVESIDWLEDFLLDWPGTLLFITHDRGFLQRLATRIVELDRGSCDGFPRRLRELPAAARRDGQRRGPGAGALRQEAGAGRGLDAPGHQGAAHAQRGPGAPARGACARIGERRGRQGTARIAMNAAERSGKLVCRGERRQLCLGRQADHPRLLDHHPAR